MEIEFGLVEEKSYSKLEKYGFNKNVYNGEEYYYFHGDYDNDIRIKDGIVVIDITLSYCPDIVNLYTTMVKDGIITNYE